MKTNEFIKEVEALGFDTGIFFETGVSVRTEYGGDILKIGSRSVYKIDCFHFAYDNLDTCTREKLFKLAVEYASTPLEEREEEKKYYIRLKGIRDNESYVNLRENDNELSMSTIYQPTNYKTQFTKSEIERYGLEKFADNELFELVEVE